MRLSFNPDGTPQAFYSHAPATPAGPLDRDISQLPPWVMRLAAGAWQQGRITLIDGQICLDGLPLTLPTQRPQYTYAQALAVINGSTFGAGAKEFFRDLLELLAEHGKVKL